MIARLFRALWPLAALLAGIVLTGCETSPATGRSFFTGGLSAEDEAQLGAQQHGQVLKEFGGAYDDPELARYVSSLGDFLTETSELPDLKFTFTVLDSPIVNAFALPGGYVYVTRGLVALANDEAELAGVIAHEIGHVTARHAAERHGQSVAASILSGGVGLVLGSSLGTQAAQGASALILKSWSRDQEFEADLLGVRYLTRAGFEPEAMGQFLQSLEAHSRLEAAIQGNPEGADRFSLLQTHPRTADRVKAAMAQAGVQSVEQPIVGRDVYLGKIDGLLYGDSPKNGFIRGRRFVHPELRFAFEAPRGFRLINTAQRVIAVGPENAGIALDLAPQSAGFAPAPYLVNVWGKDLALQDVENLSINGMAAATGWLRASTRDGDKDLRLVVIRYDAQHMYRLLFVYPTRLAASLIEPFKATTYSFQKLSASEAAAIRPLRVRTHQVRPGETPAGLAKLMAVPNFPLERFLVLNGLGREATLTPGQFVKIVRE